jgi:predicted 3-demethylubiquinone-9 3-methyltransferase (glyoxalase superfamily)
MVKIAFCFIQYVRFRDHAGRSRGRRSFGHDVEHTGMGVPRWRRSRRSGDFESDALRRQQRLVQHAADPGIGPRREFSGHYCAHWRTSLSEFRQRSGRHAQSRLTQTTEFPLTGHKEHTNMKLKNTICLWFDKNAQDAARFYAATFPDSKVTAVHEAPADYPGGKKGDVLTVEFTVLGIPCLGLNGGPDFKHSEAFSFQVATDNQEETDRYWNAIVGNGGKESQCGWCKDRWGLSWQITPRALTDALAAGGGEAKRAFEAMMPMKKIDVATIEAARRG